LATPPNCLWNGSKTKHLDFTGRPQKLLADRQVLRLSNLGDLKSHSSGIPNHSVSVGLYHHRWT
jgi:hypothetical protein